jgi:hypothetical protein
MERLDMGGGEMIRQIIAHDQNLITYRPALRAIGGSVAGTVLLQQIMYWDDKANGKFYKFSERCEHDAYKEGDSWEEELGMSAKELRTALNHFAFKCGKKNKDKFGEEYNAKREASVVQYYTDSGRVTWYMLNRDVLSKLLSGIYKETDQAEVTLYTETNTETTAESAGESETNNSNTKPSPPPPKKKKAWVPPTETEVREWADWWAQKKERNPKGVCAVAEEARQYYERMDWKNRNGKRVQVWKTTIAGNWLTDEKITKATTGSFAPQQAIGKDVCPDFVN